MRNWLYVCGSVAQWKVDRLWPLHKHLGKRCIMLLHLQAFVLKTDRSSSARHLPRLLREHNYPTQIEATIESHGSSSNTSQGVKGEWASADFKSFHLLDIHASCLRIVTLIVPAGLTDLGNRKGCRWCALEARFSDVYPLVETGRVNGMLHEVKPPEEVWVSVSSLRTRDVGL